MRTTRVERRNVCVHAHDHIDSTMTAESTVVIKPCVIRTESAVRATSAMTARPWKRKVVLILLMLILTRAARHAIFHGVGRASLDGNVQERWYERGDGIRAVAGRVSRLVMARVIGRVRAQIVVL